MQYLYGKKVDATRSEAEQLVEKMAAAMRHGKTSPFFLVLLYLYSDPALFFVCLNFWKQPGCSADKPGKPCCFGVRSIMFSCMGGCFCNNGR